MLAVLLLASAVAAPLWAAGTVEEVRFFSNALGTERSVLVYLPEGYETSSDSYPVIYFIGSWMTGGPGAWLSPEPDYHHDQLDQMIGEGLIDPVIFVEVDPNAEPWAPGFPARVPAFMTDSELTGDHETAMVEDLVPWIEAAYRTVPDREHRAVCGASAGGYSAARLALRHSDLFGTLLTQVGTIAMEVQVGAVPLILSEYPGGPPYDFTPAAGLWSIYGFTWCAAMTPNLSNPPWFVDFWIDENGEIIPDIMVRYMSQSNSRWAAEMVASGGSVEIFMSAGDQDFYLPFTTYFANDLDNLGIPYILHVFQGEHDRTLFKPHLTFFMPLNATLELRPRVINARNWWIPVRASIELPGDLDAATIDPRTIAITAIDGVELDEPIPAVGVPELTDLNGNGRTDLNVLFDKQQVLAAIAALEIPPMQPFDVTVEGETEDLLFLAATDSLRWTTPHLCHCD
jgi:enterochelin esterase-like enzyme